MTDGFDLLRAEFPPRDRPDQLPVRQSE